MWVSSKKNLIINNIFIIRFTAEVLPGQPTEAAAELPEPVRESLGAASGTDKIA